MNWVTILVLLVLGLMTWRAYRNGFVRELVSLAAVIVAVPIAGVFYDDLYPNVEPIIDNRVLAALISFLALLGGVIIGGQVTAHLLKRSVEMLNLGGADALAGAAFGFIKGVLVCQVVLIALVVFPDPDLREDIDNSAIGRALVDSAPVVLTLLPGSFENRVDRFIDGVFDDDDAQPTPTPSSTGTTPTG